MADNKRTLQLRMQTIHKVSKITNAMKLVSLSKLQKFRREIEQYQGLTESFDEIPFDIFENIDQPNLFICFSPDLGMVSQYNNTLMSTVEKLAPDAVIWIGQEAYEHVVRSKQFNVLNEQVISSEHFLPAQFAPVIDDYQSEYNILIQSSRMNGDVLDISFIPFQHDLTFDDVVEYDMNYESVNARYRYIQSRIKLRQAYLEAKYAENFVRRIAMEKATDSANEMQDELGHRYHRLRQEQITQEILEIS